MPYLAMAERDRMAGVTHFIVSFSAFGARASRSWGIVERTKAPCVSGGLLSVTGIALNLRNADAPLPVLADVLGDS